MSPKLQRVIADFAPATIIAVAVLAPWIIAKMIEERRVRRSNERRAA